VTGVTHPLPSVEDALAQQAQTMNRDVVLIDDYRSRDGDLLIVIYDCEINAVGFQQRQRRFACWTTSQAVAVNDGICWSVTTEDPS
jgi:hypothetical protein